MTWPRRERQVVIRTDPDGMLTAVHVTGRGVNVVVVEEQEVKRTWLTEGETTFNGGPDDDRPIVVRYRGDPPTFTQVADWLIRQERQRPR